MPSSILSSLAISQGLEPEEILGDYPQSCPTREPVLEPLGQLLSKPDNPLIAHHNGHSQGVTQVASTDKALTAMDLGASLPTRPSAESHH